MTQKIYGSDLLGCCHRLTKARFEHKLTTRDQAKNVAHLRYFHQLKLCILLLRHFYHGNNSTVSKSPAGVKLQFTFKARKPRRMLGIYVQKPRISRCDWSKAESRDSFGVCLYNGLLKTTGGVSHQHLQLA